MDKSDKGYEDSLKIVQGYVDSLKEDISRLDAVDKLLDSTTINIKKSELFDKIFLLQDIRQEIMNALCGQGKYK